MEGDQRAVWLGQEKIVFEAGRFVCIDRQQVGRTISHQEARQKERAYEQYQAQMGAQRGGLGMEQSMYQHGFVKNARGGWDYGTYKVDDLLEKA